MGGPLVLATLAYAVVSLALIYNHHRLHRETYNIRADQARMSHDQLAFLMVFALKVALGVVVFVIKPWLRVLFLASYAIYAWREIKDSHKAPEEEIEPLKIQPSLTAPSWKWAALQTGLAIVVIGIASNLFVGQLETIGKVLHWSPHLVALLLSPVATELPEMMNAIIWIRQGKERLALANISGAMMIQATIPSALGIIFTPWLFDGPLIAAGIFTGVAIIYLWSLFRRESVDARALVAVGSLYIVFVLLILFYL